MPVFYLHDTRVIGATPQCDLPFQVNPNDNTGDAIRRFADQIQSRFAGTASTNILRILAHGSANGILLGAPGCNQDNVNGFFAPMSGKLRTIELRCCAAALIYNRGHPPAGTYDGALFCSRLAIAASAFVMASDTVQVYIPSQSITNTTGRSQLWRWQGIVGTWNQQGRLVGTTDQDQRDSQRALGY